MFPWGRMVPTLDQRNAQFQIWAREQIAARGGDTKKLPSLLRPGRHGPRTPWPLHDHPLTVLNLHLLYPGLPRYGTLTENYTPQWADHLKDLDPALGWVVPGRSFYCERAHPLITYFKNAPRPVQPATQRDYYELAPASCARILRSPGALRPAA